MVLTPLFAPAAERNCDPIFRVLKTYLPPRGRVLEVASGTGQHAAYFAKRLKPLEWQPSDRDAESLESIEAHRELARLPSLLPPLQLDVSTPLWPDLAVDAIVCINMIHISPWSATEGLARHAAKLLKPGQTLFLYGPYRRDDVPTAPSNEAFDQSLRERNPTWGVRRLEDVTTLMDKSGFHPGPVVEMPANNLSVLFFKS